MVFSRSDCGRAHGLHLATDLIAARRAQVDLQERFYQCSTSINLVLFKDLVLLVSLTDLSQIANGLLKLLFSHDISRISSSDQSQRTEVPAGETSPT